VVSLESSLTVERYAEKTEEKLRRWKRKYSSLFRAGKFATGSAIGFLDTEIILTSGTYLLYGKLSAPQSAFSSPIFWALNVLAFFVGVSVAFFVNESLLIRNEGRRINYGLSSILTRLAKFQISFLAGNVAMTAVQLLLLKEVSFPPVFGNIVGAIVSFPISYFFALHFVWQLNGTEINRRASRGQTKIDARSGLFPQLSERDLIEILSRRISTPYGNYGMNVKDYRFDVIPKGNNQTTIDFSVRMDVVPETEA
jgi:putative flippase GtrA